MPVERLEQRVDNNGSGVPGGFVEGRPKPIRSGAGGGMHREEGRLNFSMREGFVEGGQARDRVRVERVQVKTPSGMAGSSKERVVKIKEEFCFLFMPKNFHIVMIKHLNFVAPQSLRSTGMEVSGVFIPFDDRPNLTSLFP
jgi:hypothetical protein